MTDFYWHISHNCGSHVCNKSVQWTYIRCEDAAVVKDAESFKTQILQVRFNFLHTTQDIITVISCLCNLVMIMKMMMIHIRFNHQLQHKYDGVMYLTQVLPEPWQLLDSRAVLHHATWPKYSSLTLPLQPMLIVCPRPVQAPILTCSYNVLAFLVQSSFLHSTFWKSQFCSVALLPYLQAGSRNDSHWVNRHIPGISFEACYWKFWS